MKKNYNQPIVEAVEVKATSMLMDASPNILQVGEELTGEGD